MWYLNNVTDEHTSITCLNNDFIVYNRKRIGEEKFNKALVESRLNFEEHKDDKYLIRVMAEFSFWASVNNDDACIIDHSGRIELISNW